MKKEEGLIFTAGTGTMQLKTEARLGLVEGYLAPRLQVRRLSECVSYWINNKLLTALLPLNCCGGFAGNIVGDAGNARDFVDDAPGNRVEQLVRQMRPVGRHEIHGLYGA